MDKQWTDHEKYYVDLLYGIIPMDILSTILDGRSEDEIHVMYNQLQLNGHTLKKISDLVDKALENTELIKRWKILVRKLQHMDL